MLKNCSLGVLLLSLGTITAGSGAAWAQNPSQSPMTLDRLIRLSAADARPIDTSGDHQGAGDSDASQRSPSLADMIRSQAIVYRIDQVSHSQQAEESSIDDLSLEAASSDAVSRGDRYARKWQVDSVYQADPAEADQESVPDRSMASRLRQLRKPVSQITIQPRIEGRVTPENRAALDSPQQEAILISALGAGVPLPDRYTIGFQHRPLYYQQLNLERCGTGCGYFQNAVSAAQFLTNTMLLPYHMSEKRPDCPIATRGDCKACQSYPVKLNPFPLDLRAMTTETAALAGFSFLLL